jgi:hypothetical protein
MSGDVWERDDHATTYLHMYVWTRKKLSKTMHTQLQNVSGIHRSTP